MRKSLVFVTMLVGLIVSSCGLVPGMAVDQLEGTSWILESYGNNELIPGTSMTAMFQDGQVSGSASCNHYFGTYKTHGSEISIEGLGWTEMACMDPEGIMAQEVAIMQRLGSASSYQVQGERLIIESDAGGQLIFNSLQTE